MQSQGPAPLPLFVSCRFPPSLVWAGDLFPRFCFKMSSVPVILVLPRICPGDSGPHRTPGDVPADTQAGFEPSPATHWGEAWAGGGGALRGGACLQGGGGAARDSTPAPPAPRKPEATEQRGPFLKAAAVGSHEQDADSFQGSCSERLPAPSGASGSAALECWREPTSTACCGHWC